MSLAADIDPAYYNSDLQRTAQPIQHGWFGLATCCVSDMATFGHHNLCKWLFSAVLSAGRVFYGSLLVSGWCAVGVRLLLAFVV